MALQITFTGPANINDTIKFDWDGFFPATPPTLFLRSHVFKSSRVNPGEVTIGTDAITQATHYYNAFLTDYGSSFLVSRINNVVIIAANNGSTLSNFSTTGSSFATSLITTPPPTIIINQSPTLNSVVLDANNTLISINSTRGLGYYFRAKIYINGVLFDEQGWSRKDDFAAEKDLKKLYNAYFKTIFDSNFQNGMFEQTHLKKKVSIIIEEKLLINDNLVDTITLPDFFIIYNNKPALFNQNLKVQFLGIETQILSVPDGGKLSIPFFVNLNNENIDIELLDNFGTIIDGITSFNLTGKKTYLYNLDLSNLSLANNTDWLKLNITINGSHLISKTIRLMNFPNYAIKELSFLNNFGYYLYAYLDGQLVIENDLEPKTYTQLDNSEVVYEINEKQVYTINSGLLLPTEKEVINQIATALKSKINLNNEWLEMVTETKKVLNFKERNNTYSDKLVFSVKKNSLVATPLIFNKTIIINNFYKTTGTNYKIFFLANFPLTSLFLEHSMDGINWSVPVALSAIISPQTLSLTLTNNEFIRLKDITAGVTTYSNVFNYIFVASTISIQQLSLVTDTDSNGSFKVAELNINISNFANIGFLRWKAHYYLPAGSNLTPKVYLAGATSWPNYYWTNPNNMGPGNYNSAIVDLIPAANGVTPFTQSPISIEMMARANNQLVADFWIYDINNTLLGTAQYALIG